MDDAATFLRILNAFDAGEIVGACAWCGNLRIDGEWVAPPTAIFDAVDTRHLLSHSICDACSAPYLQRAASREQDAERRPRVARLAF